VRLGIDDARGRRLARSSFRLEAIARAGGSLLALRAECDSSVRLGAPRRILSQFALRKPGQPIPLKQAILASAQDEL
jgi:hypothetical protein